ncbi:hypothetical protein ACFORG_19420 [Lutimaribacter marinistellae]|uniref:Uncharacterized protein n=1 Tax=Lutimaribacter marinistellae TaxID=1820329 RepID=A0ABV7TNA0_9RHOB
MTHTGRYHGGLVFLSDLEGALDRFCRITSATLEDYGHSVDRQSITSPVEARVVASHYMVKLSLETLPGGERDVLLDEAAGLNRRVKPRKPRDRQRLVIELTPVASASDDRDISELMLVVMLYRMVDIYASEYIEWLSPDVHLTIEQFLGAFANVSPRRVRGRQQIIANNGKRFADIEETAPDLAMRYDRIAGQNAHAGNQGLVRLTEEEALALAFRAAPHPNEVDGQPPEEEAESDIRRLTAWGMTGMLCFVSAPVAAAMAAVNLLRGEDFRLNTQVLALTGAVATIAGSGMLGEALSLLSI